MELTAQSIKDICTGEGALMAGISPVGRFTDARPGHGPVDRLAGCRSVIVVGSPFPPELITTDMTVYTRVRNATTSQMRDIAERVANRMTGEGYRTHVISVCNERRDEPDYWDHMSMKRAAENAGLGRIIRNHLLTNPVYGNLLWFAVILTDGEFAPDDIMEKDFCGGCDLCVVACPAGALNDPEQLNQEACDKYRCKVVDGEKIYICYECRRACPLRYGVPERAAQ